MIEHRKFKASSAIIPHLIHSQSGSICKAVLEAAMNSADAGATRIDIDFTPARVAISDNGKGFVSEDEVLRYFEVFGEKHTDGDARFGKFRLGRGQLFSFGVNRWRSGTFEMRVNVQDDENPGYDLEKNLPPHAGCLVEVDFYDVANAWEVRHTQQEISKYIKWFDIEVYFNGEKVSTDPATAKWDFENNDFYFKFSSSDYAGLEIYNMGAFVCSVGVSKFGLAGTLVSKKNLTLNMARNQVLDKDPDWKRMGKALRRLVDKKQDKKITMTDNEKDALICRIADGETSIDKHFNLGLLRSVSGRRLSFKHIIRNNFEYSGRFTFAKRGSIVGDKVMQSGLALVFSDELLELLSIRPEQFKMYFDDGDFSIRNQEWEYVPFEKLSGGFTESHEILIDDKLRPTELAKLNVLRLAFSKFHYNQKFEPSSDCVDAPRSVHVGVSDSALGWTDGESYIAINREYLKQMDGSIKGYVRMAQVLMHEFCHKSPSSESHVHSPEFYESYHELYASIAELAHQMSLDYAHSLRALKVKLNKKVSTQEVAQQETAALQNKIASMEAQLQPGA